MFKSGELRKKQILRTIKRTRDYNQISYTSKTEINANFFIGNLLEMVRKSSVETKSAMEYGAGFHEIARLVSARYGHNSNACFIGAANECVAIKKQCALGLDRQAAGPGGDHGLKCPQSNYGYVKAHVLLRLWQLDHGELALES